MKLFLLQAVIFIIGVILLIIDDSRGYFINMSIMSYIGTFLCVIGIAFRFIYSKIFG